MKAWKQNIRKVMPYTPGEQPNKPDMVKLNTNENPYPPAPGVIRVLNEMDENKLKLYPDSDSTELVDSIAQFYNVLPEQVFVGVGSDDVLGMAFLTYFNSDKPILFPDITYSFYDVWAELFKIPYELQKVDDEFKINPSDYFKENGGIIIPNPNAPTAIEMAFNDIEDIVKNNQDSVVIIDEAYIDFGGESVLPLIDKYENLVVVRTFSKSRSAAGMRIGFAIGNKELINAIKAVKNSYNSYTMNLPSISAGVEAVKDKKYFEETVEKIVCTRENAKIKLKELGFSFTDSKTNFLFATHNERSAKEIFDYLKTKNIYVRYFEKPRIDNYLRITIGTDKEMEKLYQALNEFFE